IEPDWHVYSQFTPEGGPLPLELIFKNSAGNFQLIGKATESKTSRAYNDIFEVDEVFFANKATVRQKVKVLNGKLTKIDVTLEYQVCKEVCINQRKQLSFRLPAIVLPADSPVAVPITEVDTANSEIQPVITDTIGEQNIIVKAINAPDQAPPVRNLWSIFFIAFL